MELIVITDGALPMSLMYFRYLFVPTATPVVPTGRL